jgi:DNA-binding CsgD family transcriptional regulator
MDQKSNVQPATGAVTDRLSKRQRQCLALVANGYTSKEIGRDLGLSPSTVDNHINTAIERLGCNNRAIAAQIYRQEFQHNASRYEVSRQGLAGNGRHIAAGHNNIITHDGAASTASPLRAFFVPPPLGGRLNNLSLRRRYYHIFQIALLAIMGFSAATVTIAGIVHLFSK